MQFSGNKAEKKGSGQSADKSENKAEIVIHTRVTGIRGILDRQVVFTLSRFIFPHKNALRRMEMQSHFLHEKWSRQIFIIPYLRPLLIKFSHTGFLSNVLVKFVLFIPGKLPGHCPALAVGQIPIHHHRQFYILLPDNGNNPPARKIQSRNARRADTFVFRLFHAPCPYP